MKDSQNFFGFARFPDHLCRFLDRDAHRFLHDDVFSGAQTLNRNAGMKIMRQHDNAQIGDIAPQQIVDSIESLYFREIGGSYSRALRGKVANGGQTQAVGLLNNWPCARPILKAPP